MILLHLVDKEARYILNIGSYDELNSFSQSTLIFLSLLLTTKPTHDGFMYRKKQTINCCFHVQVVEREREM